MRGKKEDKKEKRKEENFFQKPLTKPSFTLKMETVGANQ
jgi:hypothetical protein